MSSIQQSLSKIEDLLSAVVGGRAGTRKMRPAEFVAYAHEQVAAAMSEPSAASTRRLKALHKAVQVAKDNYSSDEAVDVPIYVNDTTAMDDKSTTLQTPLAAANANPDGQSAFEQGFIAKFQGLREQIAALLKALPSDIAENGDEDEEKRKKAAEAAPDPAEPDDEEKRKTKAAEEPEDPDAEKRKPAAKVNKGADVSADGTQWPSDLNEPGFAKTGKVEKSVEWGADAS